MSCSFASENWRCTELAKAGSDLCPFHDADWSAKLPQVVQQQVDRMLGAVAPGEILRFDGWIIPAGVTFARTTFRAGVSFQGTHFHGQETSFAGARFPEGSSFRDAVFHGDASFRGAELKGCSFRNVAFLRRCDFRDANLEGADLRESRGLLLDHTYARGAQVDELASDPWSVLRRNYTGTMFTVHLLLLIGFLLPYVARTGLLLGQNRVQTSALTAVADVVTAAEAIDRPDAERLRATLTAAIERVRRTKPCLALTCREYTVAQVLVGWDRGVGWFLLVLALLAYNLLRGLLTYHVSVMRDAEERSGFSPRWVAQTRSPFRQLARSRMSGWAKLIAVGLDQSHTIAAKEWTYHWMHWAHRVMRALAIVAAVSFAAHLYDWLTRPVWLAIP